MSTYKVVEGGTLYVFWRGRLIYKRRLGQEHGVFFDEFGPPWDWRGSW